MDLQEKQPEVCKIDALTSKVFNELIDNYDPKEQREVIKILDAQIMRYYSSRIEDLENELKRIHELRNQFRGEDPKI